MKKALVGYTGFVGSNLCSSVKFDYYYNSTNIKNAFGSKPDLLIYSGVRAEKFLANRSPDKDMENIITAEENISKIEPRKIVLISTVDVFKHPVNVDESSPIDTVNLHPYGLNRYRLEKWVRHNYSDALIVRLPALFGVNLKKNFIYDMINKIPSLLKNEKLIDLSLKEPELLHYYRPYSNGFHKAIFNEKDREKLIKIFLELDYSALNFTDSRSVFQFYPLSRLWQDINIAMNKGLTLFHTATEPISASEIYAYIIGEKFNNILAAQPANYNYKTLFSDLFGSNNGYIESRKSILEKLKQFYFDSNLCMLK